MILKFIQADSHQPILIMASAIASVENDDVSQGVAVIRTTDARLFYVLATVEQILAEVIGQTSIPTMAIAPIG